MLAPLSLMYLAASTPREVDVRIIDENVEPLDFSERPDLAGITTFTATARRAYEISERYRSMGANVVLGGVHASVLHDEALEHADSVVIGEGETAWVKVIADAAAGRLQPVYKEEFSDFASPEKPRRDLVSPASYWSANVVQTVRGCPRNCSFCSVTGLAGRRYRLRDVDGVLREVEGLPVNRALGRRLVPFVDAEAAPSRAHAANLFEGLIPLKVAWGSRASLSFARDEDLVRLAARSGCRFLMVGLDGVITKKGVRAGGRSATVDECERAVRLLDRYGIGVIADFHFGFDSDDGHVFDEALELARRNPFALVRFQCLTPYPGTPVYERLLAEGRLEREYWLDRSWEHRLVFQPLGMSAEALEHSVKRIHETYYGSAAVFRRAALNRRRPLDLPLNILYRKAIRSRKSA